MPESPAPKPKQKKPKTPANKKGGVSLAITTIPEVRVIKAELKPKAAELVRKKAAFVTELRANGGLINQALIASKLPKKTAYAHFNSDPAFRNAWLEAGETAHEDLTAKILKRADASDTLLIYAHRQSENKNKWRRRIREVAQASVNAVREAGAPAGMTEDQIQAVEQAILEKYKYISLQ